MKRLFLAIPFAQSVQDDLHGLALRLQAQIGGRAVRRGNFHITLYFIGLCDQTREAAARRVLTAAPRPAPFAMQFGKLGRFVRGAQALLWVGVDEERRSSRLYDAMLVALDREGFPSEKKPYLPHVTLLRDVPAQAANSVMVFPVALPPAIAAKIVLFESVTGPQGLVYEPLASTGD